jgi:hypothetical protein
MPPLIPRLLGTFASVTCVFDSCFMSSVVARSMRVPRRWDLAARRARELRQPLAPSVAVQRQRSHDQCRSCKLPYCLLRLLRGLVPKSSFAHPRKKLRLHSSFSFNAVMSLDYGHRLKEVATEFWGHSGVHSSILAL